MMNVSADRGGQQEGHPVTPPAQSNFTLLDEHLPEDSFARALLAAYVATAPEKREAALRDLLTARLQEIHGELEDRCA